ncbi:MAG: ROK family protein [Candidatus Izemoplasma sp.]|nr:ROK family protein [Candidatus Izemoplasma sp.]
MKTSNSKSIKAENTKLVVEKLVELKETTRIELARLTTLNKATISSIIQGLIKKQIVIKTDKSIKTSGRSAKVIALNKNAGRILSLDLQTTQIYGVITNLYGEMLFEIKHPISNPNFSPYLEELLKTIDELKDNTFDSTYGIIGIGIGVYGIIDKNHRIKFAPFTSWKNIELKTIIEDYTGLDTYVENEANISALGENTVYPDHHNLITLNIGVGVGMGIVINNTLYTGEDGFAGEIGHTIIHPGGNPCVCGNNGCLETYLKDSAIINRYHQLTGVIVDLDELIQRYKLKDPYAMKVYSEFIENVSITVNNISQMLNPKAIIINSVIVQNISESISLIKNNLHSQIMNLDILTTSKYRAKTNVIGLAHLLIQDFLKIDNYTPRNIA